MVARIDTENSRIIFSVKGFIGVVSFIFTVFFGFYLMVVQPRLQQTDEKIEKIVENQNQINKEINASINNLNVTIARLSETIENIK